ncbi:MAG TPA: hypothetical protein VIM55_12740 [Mucilaginibacter sp.]
MNILTIIALMLGAIALVMKVFSSKKPAQITSRPSDAKLPTTLIDNDKIIVVNNVAHDDIRKALIGLCNSYNQETFSTLPRLWQLLPNSFAITFPYNIDFAGFCFAVNFLEYPADIKWNAKVRGWATMKLGDDWVTGKSANKHVMLFIAANDKEYDNVFITTEDGIGYKFGFAAGEEKQLLSQPNEIYEHPWVEQDALNGLNYEDFK